MRRRTCQVCGNRIRGRTYYMTAAGPACSGKCVDHLLDAGVRVFNCCRDCGSAYHGCCPADLQRRAKLFAAIGWPEIGVQP